MKKIAIVKNTRNEALDDALKLHLGRTHKNTQFVTVSRQVDVPEDASIACRGLPQFVTGNRPIVFHNVGVAWDKDDTPAMKRERWDTVTAEDSTIQEILPQLGWTEEILILPSKCYAEAKNLITEARLNVSEAETDAELLAAYKNGFNTLRDILVPKAAPAPQAAVEEAPAESSEPAPADEDHDEAPL